MLQNKKMRVHILQAKRSQPRHFWNFVFWTGIFFQMTETVRRFVKLAPSPTNVFRKAPFRSRRATVQGEDSNITSKTFGSFVSLFLIHD